MKIGFISDTHGSLFYTKKALEKLGPCDLIIHLGDVLYHGPRNPVHETYEPAALAEFLKDKQIEYIRGNCDSDVDSMVTAKDIYQKQRIFDLKGLRIFAIHGYEEDLEERIRLAKDHKADILAFGHSHIKLCEKLDDLLVINPGSTTLPKDGSRSVGLYEDGDFSFIYLD